MSKETNGNANWKSAHKSEGIILGGKVKESNIIPLMQKYINQYVTCTQCKSCNTIMLRDTSARSFLIKCNVCKSTKYV